MYKTRPVVTGEKFGRLTILKEIERKNNKRWILCKCDCGSEKGYNLKKVRIGETKSCGCARGNLDSGLKYIPRPSFHYLYETWLSMKSRCYSESNDDFKNYGARGILVCDRWKNSFLLFVEDVEPRPSPEHTIDRINVDGDYSPENFRWATQKQQQRNKRNNIFITYNGERKCMSEWAEYFGLDRRWFSYRYKRYGIDYVMNIISKK